MVSIIIPVYNGLPWLEEQLQSLAEQDYDGPFEVLVSDNGSSDGVRDVIDGHTLTAALQLRYVDSSGRRGAPYARNHAAEVARGDFLAFVDQDDRAHPGWLSAMVRTAERHDAVSGAVEVESINSATVASWRPMPAPEEGFSSHYLPWANGNNIGFWRTTLEKIGGYDETLTVAGDDFDVSWRVQQAGFTLGHSPEALMAYRLRSTYRDTWGQALNYGRGGLAAFRKHRPFGCPPLPWQFHVNEALALLIHNPVLPLTRHRIPTGQWILRAGMSVGRLDYGVRAMMPGRRNV